MLTHTPLVPASLLRLASDDDDDDHGVVVFITRPGCTLISRLSSRRYYYHHAPTASPCTLFRTRACTPTSVAIATVALSLYLTRVRALCVCVVYASTLSTFSCPFLQLRIKVTLDTISTSSHTHPARVSVLHCTPSVSSQRKIILFFGAFSISSFLYRTAAVGYLNSSLLRRGRHLPLIDPSIVVHLPPSHSAPHTTPIFAHSSSTYSV